MNDTMITNCMSMSQRDDIERTLKTVYNRFKGDPDIHRYALFKAIETVAKKIERTPIEEDRKFLQGVLKQYMAYFFEIENPLFVRKEIKPDEYLKDIYLAFNCGLEGFVHSCLQKIASADISTRILFMQLAEGDGFPPEFRSYVAQYLKTPDERLMQYAHGHDS